MQQFLIYFQRTPLIYSFSRIKASNAGILQLCDVVVNELLITGIIIKCSNLKVLVN